MHKVFIDNKPLVFEEVYGDIGSKYPQLMILSDAAYSLSDVIDRIVNENINGIVYLSDSPDRQWSAFADQYIIIEAAGGLVRNEKGEILTIFRKKVWDLPKGKLDFEETPENAAVREVSEECGITKVELNAFLMKTFHVYTEKKKKYLKKTFWYTMTAGSEEALIPQSIEKIEKVEWMDKNKIAGVFLKNTYNSIAEVLEKYFELNK